MKTLIKKFFSRKAKKQESHVKSINLEFQAIEMVKPSSKYDINEKIVLYKAIYHNTLISGVFKVVDKEFIRNKDFLDGVWAYRLNVPGLERQWWGEMIIKPSPELSNLNYYEIMDSIKNPQEFI